MAIAIRNAREIEALRKPSRIVAKALDLVRQNAKAGVSLNELNDIADDFIHSQGARAAFKGLYGFPKAVCLSVNAVIIHGIPSDYKLKNGDVLGVDIGVECGGWFGDGAITCGIGEIAESDKNLIACAKDTLLEAISHLKPGMRFKELSKLLQDLITARGFVPLRGYCGHGIGTRPHEEPEIPNFIDTVASQGPKIRSGMVFCIEPMVCQKDGNYKVLDDKWSVVSEDGLNGSHYEHTIAILGSKAEILTEI